MTRFWTFVCCFLGLMAVLVLTFMFLAYASWIWSYVYNNNGFNSNGANTQMSEWYKLFWISLGGTIYSGATLLIAASIWENVLPEYRKEKLERKREKERAHREYLRSLERDAGLV